jgi:hypothetical protein
MNANAYGVQLFVPANPNGAGASAQAMPVPQARGVFAPARPKLALVGEGVLTHMYSFPSPPPTSPSSQAWPARRRTSGCAARRPDTSGPVW